MKKNSVIIAIVLLLGLVLGSCAHKEEEPVVTPIAGEYIKEIDYYDDIVEAFDKKMNLDGDTLANYLDAFYFPVRVQFGEDGTYKARIDEATVANAMDHCIEAVTEYLRNYYIDVLVAELRNNGVTDALETRNELEAYLGKSVDESFEAVMDMPITEYAEKHIRADEYLAKLRDAYNTDHTYVQTKDEIVFDDDITTAISYELATDGFIVTGYYDVGSGKVLPTRNIDVFVSLESYESESGNKLTPFTENVAVEGLYAVDDLPVPEIEDAAKTDEAVVNAGSELTDIEEDSDADASEGVPAEAIEPAA